MLRATWKLQLMAVGMVGVTTGTAHADTDKIGNETGKAVSSIIETISNAFKGGEVGAAAQNELVKNGRYDLSCTRRPRDHLHDRFVDRTLRGRIGDKES